VYLETFTHKSRENKTCDKPSVNNALPIAVVPIHSTQRSRSMNLQKGVLGYQKKKTPRNSAQANHADEHP